MPILSKKIWGVSSMKTFFAPAVCAAAILLSSVSVDAILAPAAAQQDVSFDSFHDYLANYGDWVYSDRWGEVWVPENVPDDFQPLRHQRLLGLRPTIMAGSGFRTTNGATCRSTTAAG